MLLLKQERFPQLFIRWIVDQPLMAERITGRRDIPGIPRSERAITVIQLTLSEFDISTELSAGGVNYPETIEQGHCAPLQK